MIPFVFIRLPLLQHSRQRLYWTIWLVSIHWPEFKQKSMEFWIYWSVAEKWSVMQLVKVIWRKTSNNLHFKLINWFKMNCLCAVQLETLKINTSVWIQLNDNFFLIFIDLNWRLFKMANVVSLENYYYSL